MQQMRPLDLQKLKVAADKLKKELSVSVGNLSFDYTEQELIRRVFKSVFGQFKSVDDKSTAKKILLKTEWIDGEIG